MGVTREKMKTLSRKIGKLLLLFLPAFLISVQNLAADSATNASLDAAEKTDLETGAIEPVDSVKNNPDLLYVLEVLLRAPVTQLKDGEPPYNQQPPDAQDDFRTRVVPTPPPTVPTDPPVPTNPPVIPTMPPPPIPTDPLVPTRPPDRPRPQFPLFPGRPVIPDNPDNPDNPNDPPTLPDIPNPND
ncbi:MAG: hypothetical protein KJ002_09275 [Candidatus Dadabacteria bacterium]|nr:hypothetical protein [Candidatus Dadabacteria bacterium]